jgi:hypothetical protein
MEEDLLNPTVRNGELERGERRVAAIEDQAGASVELASLDLELHVLRGRDHEGSDAGCALQRLLQISALADATFLVDAAEERRHLRETVGIVRQC